MNTHGSGCTFASAIAAQLASGRPLHDAVLLAKAYVIKAIEKGYAIGKGPGPLAHFYRFHQEPPARGVHEVPQHGKIGRASCRDRVCGAVATRADENTN